MSKYRATAYFHFKKGMKNKGIRTLEEELVSMANQEGCLEAEICSQNENPDVVLGTGLWANEAAAKKFNHKFNEVVGKISHMLEKNPQRNLWEVSNKSQYQKMKKAA